MSIDEIIVTDSARKILEKHQILPSHWQLREGTAERIIEANIRLTIMYSPASQINLPPGDYGSLVVADVSLLEKGVITPEMQVGIFMHEIGHVLNPPPTGPNTNYVDALAYGDKFDEEVSADQFAVACGYGQSFASALKVFRERGTYGFDSDAVAERIRRLEQVSVSTQST